MVRRANDLLYRALRSRLGDFLPPVRWTKDLVLFVNEMLGRPLSPADRASGSPASPVAPLAAVSAGQPPAETPVVIYVEDDSTRERDTQRELTRIVNVLKRRSIPYEERTVTLEPDARDWMRSGTARVELPLVFIGDRPVGGYHEIVRLDVSGRLSRMFHGF